MQGFGPFGPFGRVARATVAVFLAGAVLALSGCATPEQRVSRDPFEPFNRGVMEFNEGVDRALLKPVATAYRQAVPGLVRTGVSNFFGNIGDVWSAVNSLLQLKIGNAFESAMRVHVNTFFGMGGLFDLASEFNIERHKEDFGQTLGRWGVPAGPFLMLPLLGPSTVRDTLAMPVDRRFDPFHDVNPDSSRNAFYALRLIDKRANLLMVGDVLENAALDRYTFTRDAYLQRRRAEITSDGERDRDRDAGQTPKLDEAPAGSPRAAPARP
ncbi:MlaA family lipoprotein [Ramlibacter sp.]|uniref:MlaA family lipoprotein n=1 Tax=Ramlibacter sp. TaxID=1917967 RepID=UPI003D11597C